MAMLRGRSWIVGIIEVSRLAVTEWPLWYSMSTDRAKPALALDSSMKRALLPVWLALGKSKLALMVG